VRQGSARILIVDETPFYPQFVQVVLEAQGYTAMVARDCATALEMVAAERPDLVILEIMMTQSDGFELCEQLRDASTVPIIILTSMLDPEEKIKGLQAGADYYLTKPFSTDELVARVGALLRRVELSKNGTPWTTAPPFDIEVSQGLI
jgi:DNA-binding response OmpR family regulator